MPSEPRAADRTSYYTVKTSPSHPQTHSRSRSRSGSYSQAYASSPHAHAHAHTNSQSFFANKAPASAPMGSPRVVHSAGAQGSRRPSPGTSRVSGPDARTPSPNYFGLSVEPAVDPRDSSNLPRDNWSPATSSVKPFATALPNIMPLDANPEFEAFRRQADANRGRTAFALSSSYLGPTPSASGFSGLQLPSTSMPSAQQQQQRPRPPRWHTHGSSFPGSSLTRVPGEFKCNPATAVTALPNVLGQDRHESPAQMETPFDAPNEPRSTLSRVDDRYPRLSMTQDRADPPSPHPKQRPPRADTAPMKSEAGGPDLMTPLQLKQLLEGGSRNTLLLLDLRVSPQYAQSRIKGALNLCIPTTLLKRATYNLPKLEQTFQSNTDREEFTKWRETTHLVVYDSFSQDKRDAVSGMNMIKKFTSEGYMGETFLLRGGFNDFATKCPGLIDSSATGLAKPGLSLSGTNKGSSLGLGKADAGAPGVAPVIGGVVLPQASNNSNPFFSNIRQNQDLVDGVGQIEVGVPQGLDAESLPLWLRQVAASDDKGKRVADKFLRIELKEQSRMKAAYSMFSHAVPARLDAATDDFQKTVQLSGIEKGGKNRYKDILPFEHARVKLQGREQGSCDYVNASHVRVGGSHKRYIASQGPLPATFEVSVLSRSLTRQSPSDKVCH